MESQYLLIGLCSVIVFGILAQWIAWRIRVPSILLLLAAGVAAGPITGIVQPDQLFGDLLTPAVSLAVALILFEGGLTLRFQELKNVGSVVWKLVSIGALITMALTTAAAHWVLQLDWIVSVLLGAVLIVTGPTVVGPLLNFIRPKGPSGSVLKWEGIVIDPIGAVLAVLVFEAILVGKMQGATLVVVKGVAITAFAGALIGAAGAFLIVVSLRRHWIPEHLHVPGTLMFVTAVFGATNVIQKEAGLLSVTVMGVILANQSTVVFRHVKEFKENLSVLLLGTLFVILAARLPADYFLQMNWRHAAFLAVIILIIRPLAAFVCTLTSVLTWRERLLIAWMAPRGIVAAAISSVFALELAHAGYEQADQLVPVAFLVIGGTVLIYGLTARPLARALGLAASESEGCLLVGAHRLAREMAKVLNAEGFETTLCDNSWRRVMSARMEGLNAIHGDVLDEDFAEKLELSSTGKMLALTGNDDVNALAALQWAQFFGRQEVYHLPRDVSYESGEAQAAPPMHMRGRTLFGADHPYSDLMERIERGAVVKATNLTAEFKLKEYRELHADKAVPLFFVTTGGRLRPVATDLSPAPQQINKVIALTEEAAPPTEHDRQNEDEGETASPGSLV